MKTENQVNNRIKISFAPLQGFTDYIFRSIYTKTFEGVDEYYIPYISLQNDGNIKKNHLREISIDNNKGTRTIPQILAGNSHELLTLARTIEANGFSEINLNLGCPYPMVAKRGKGSGLLPYPEKIKILLEDSLPLLHSSLSIKMRAGYLQPDEFIKVVEILNSFPLQKIIFHPRTGKQLYKGEADFSLFQEMSKISKHPLCYNGDIFSVTDFEKKLETFPGLKEIMIGRGILSNPFLPAEIKGIEIKGRKANMQESFHENIYEKYISVLDGDSHVLNKMRAFWQYYSHTFSNPHKVFKLIKKAKSRQKYEEATHEIFSNYI